MPNNKLLNLKDLAKRPSRLASGHRSCAGCTFPVILRTVLRATRKPVVIANATGCMEVTTTIYPDNAWEVPWIHSVFANTASTISGVESAYRSLKKQGKISREIKFIAFGGDGGTYDIGLQALSGAWERGHDFTYVCYDNEAYMNTGNQRSSATPLHAATTTTPPGSESEGKAIRRKDIVKIAAAHNLPYIAQASPSHLPDLARKTAKAIETPGPTFLNVIMPCTFGWKFPTNQGIEMARLAVATRFWPLFEITNGQLQISGNPPRVQKVEKFLETQGRFKHLFKPQKNTKAIQEIQQEVDRRWTNLAKIT